MPWPLLLCIAIAAISWVIPAPVGLSIKGWHLLTLFVATIVGIINKALPMAALTLVSLAFAIGSGTITPNDGLSGFSNQLVWLVIFALFIAHGFASTGLGERAAYHFTRMFGKRTLGLSYGLMLTDLVMAPAVPSVTARATGLIMPIMQAISVSFDSKPNHPSSRKIGAFLNLSIFHTTVITSAMFVTAMAANPMLVELARSLGYQITWLSWAAAAIVPGLANLIVMPLVLYAMCPPEIKVTPNAPLWAIGELKRMGPMKAKEWILIATLVLLLFLWIFGETYLGVKAAVAGLIGVAILMATRVVEWDEVAKKAAIWETFIWFAILLALSSQLTTLGVMEWLSSGIGAAFGNVDWHIAFPLLALFYFYTHYFFASSTAHVSVMFAPLVAVAIQLGTPPMLAIFTFAFFSNLFGCLTHYSLAPAPALFASGYV
ncbi:MAG: DASS family sodium-coupled anion symporter, partial [Pseudomonadota bacterium]